MKRLIVLILLLIPSLTMADELSFSLGSYHLDETGYLKNKEYTEFNPGIGYYFSGANIDVGTYVNSFGGNAVYLGTRANLPFTKIGLGFLRYDNYKWKNEVIYSPYIVFTKDIKNFRIGYSPMIKRNNQDKWVFGVFTFQFIVPLD